MNAEDVLKLEEKWRETKKDVIVDNLEKYLIEKKPECEKFKAKIDFLMDITGDKEQTVYAWINRSRKNVKVPFLKLCKIASALGVEVNKLLY